MRVIMLSSARPRLPLWGLSLVAGMLLASPVLAQDISTIPGAGRMATGRAHRTPDAPKAAEPSALPGARSSGAAAPFTKPPSEMGPTEALFDAVNRGDIGSAREALTRGADLGGRNALGLTPLELSVDLGQNDIAFLLLSLRDADANTGSRRQAGKATAVKEVAPARPPSPITRARTASAAPAERVAPQKQYPSDGGTPVPNAGFLGFGGGR